MRRKIRPVAACLMILAATLPALAQDAPPEDTVPIPDGWQATDVEYRFAPDSLWEYINGAAELFLGYGCRGLSVRDLERGDLMVSVSVYDMGRPLHAFGIFERERPAAGEPLAGAGARAVLQPPYRGLMLKDRFYVKVDAAGGDIDATVLGELLAAVAAGLPGGDDLPVELSYLPEQGRVPGTVAYTRRDFRGFSDLRGCIHADYRDDDAEYQLFTFRPGRDPMAAFSRQWHIEEIDGAIVAWRDVPYAGVIVIRSIDGQVMGITGLGDRDRALAVLESLREG